MIADRLHPPHPSTSTNPRGFQNILPHMIYMEWEVVIHLDMMDMMDVVD